MITTSTTAMRMIRVARGMRIIDAARKVGLRENQLSRIETIDFPIHSAEIEALALVYDVPIAVLPGAEPLVLATCALKVRD